MVTAARAGLAIIRRSIWTSLIAIALPVIAVLVVAMVSNGVGPPPNPPKPIHASAMGAPPLAGVEPDGLTAARIPIEGIWATACFVGALMVVATLPLLSVATARVATGDASKLTDALRGAGMHPAALAVGFSLQDAMNTVLLVLITSIGLSQTMVTPKSSVAGVMAAFALAMISFAGLVASVLRRPALAVTTSVVLAMAMLVPVISSPGTTYRIPTSGLALSLPSTAMAVGVAAVAIDSMAATAAEDCRIKHFHCELVGVDSAALLGITPSELTAALLGQALAIGLLAWAITRAAPQQGSRIRALLRPCEVWQRLTRRHDERATPLAADGGATAAALPSGDEVIIRELSVTFPGDRAGACCGGCRRGAPIRALRGVDTSFAAGSVTALVGANGSGKSTLLGAISGIVRPSSGLVTIGGAPAGSPDGLRSVGFCPQDASLMPGLTGGLLLHLFASARNVLLPDLAESAMAAASLVELTAEDLWKSAHQLSGGQQRRLCVALAAVGDPAALVLDEPTTGVDATSRRHVWDALRRARAAVL